MKYLRQIENLERLNRDLENLQIEFDEEIADLADEVEELEEQVEDLESKVEDLESQVEDLESQVEELEYENNKAITRNQELENNIAEYKDILEKKELYISALEAFKKAFDNLLDRYTDIENLFAETPF